MKKLIMVFAVCAAMFGRAQMIDNGLLTPGMMVVTNVPTLAQSAAAGGFAGTENIEPRSISSSIYGFLPDAFWSCSGSDYIVLGSGAEEASGTHWNSLFNGGNGSSGNYWTAIGPGAGDHSLGDYWFAIGVDCGLFAQWTNSYAFGHFAGYRSRGSNRMYFDAYLREPDENHSSTNDAIFLDSGQINLGRLGSLTNPAPNQLRGNWQINSGPIMSQAQADALYPRITGGTLTNATLAGTVIIGGEPRTNWPSGLYAGITNVSATALPSITTVHIVASKTIYKIDISTNMVFAFDFPPHDFGQSEMRFEFDANIQHTNGFNITFPNGWDYVPDLTVTGCYKFAVCASATNVMQVKQTFPTVYDWTACHAFFGPASAFQSSFVHTTIFDAGGSTNAFIGVPIDDPYTICRVHLESWLYPRGFDGVSTIRKFCSYAQGNLFLYDFLDVSKFKKVPNSFITYFDFATDHTKSVDPNFIGEGIYITYTNLTDNIIIHSIFRRKMNELEISSYNAGWRP